MIDPKFKDVKKDDWIFTIKSGWVKVVELHSRCGIKTNVYTFGGEDYDDKGFSNDKDSHCPQAWTYNPFNKDDLPPIEFKIGEVIAVRGSVDYLWKYSTYAGTDNNGDTITSNHAEWKYARRLTPTERGEE